VQLVNEFWVAVPIEQAWNVLTDIQRIAPCMPGAVLLALEGDEYRGMVKVKVGPIVAQYKGTAVFQEKNEIARKAVIKAEGREVRGQGGASALITAQLTGDGDGTTVVVTTDLHISGKAAQFGRGVLADVSTKLLQQFVRSLEADVLAASTTGPRETGTEAIPDAVSRPSGRSSIEAGDVPIGEATAAPVNLFGVVAAPLAKRAAPVALVLLALYLLLRWARK